MNRLLCSIAVLVVLAPAGCSSSGPKASAPTSSTVAAAAAVGDPAVAARTLAAWVVTEAELPPDAARSTAPPPPLLRTRQSTVAFGNLVGVDRLFTTHETPAAVVAFVQSHVSRGFVFESTDTGTVGGSRILGVIQSQSDPPTNISIVQLQVAAVAAKGGGAVVRVDSLVGWTAPKPAAEQRPRQ